MTLEQAEKIVEALESDGYEASVRPTYSGRCMYGSTCVGIVCDDPLMVGVYAGKLDVPAEDIPRRRDNMGRGWIVY